MKKSIVDWCLENNSPILTEWDYEKNKGIDINQVSYGSIKKYWWKCDKDHSWQTTPNNRTGTSRAGCPVCASKVVISGINDLKTAFPTVAEKWDYEKNSPLLPEQIFPHSNKKYWWKCSRNHSFQSEAYGMVENKERCPYCTNQKVLKGYNDLATTHPELIKEWVYEKNTLDPTEITYGNSSKVWWKCNKGHFFEAAISSRAGNQHTGCPYCAGQKVITGETDLATMNPRIASEWDYEKNVNLLPSQIMAHSNKKVGWKCTKGHHYVASVADRSAGKGCPICAGRTVEVGFNDLLTRNPQLAAEWHPTLNKKPPTEYTVGSDVKVWWMCDRGHEWSASISSRNRGNGCPVCMSETQISIPEKTIFYYVNQAYPDCTSNVNFQWLGKMELDIYVPSINTAIEYDGCKWHQIFENDLAKDKMCEENGVRLIRLREEGCPEYNSASLKIPVFKFGISAFENFVQYMLESIGPYLPNLNSISFDITRDYENIISIVSKTKKEKSLAICNPILAGEWDYDKNGLITPEMVSYGTQKSFWWKCNKGHSWKAQVLSRKRGNGCPYCSGHKVLVGESDLMTTHPKLCEQWYQDKNGELTPEMVTAGSSKNVWWRCEKGHFWHAVISSRTRTNNSQCPYCINQRVWIGYNDLATTNPELLAEWDYSKNTFITPQDVSAGSEKKVWWKCSQGHSYQTIVRLRAVLHTGCRQCHFISRKDSGTE